MATMIHRVILLAMPLVTLAVSDRAMSGGSNYNRCDAQNGPDHWPGACQNQLSGTPINLCGAIAFPSPQPTIEVTGYDVPITLGISSDGSSVKVTVTSDPPTLTVGNLSALVGRSTNSSEQIWNLEQMHLHWGRTGKTNEGSEHYLQGQAYAAEAHFVHYNSRFPNFTAAVGSGASDALLVVGVFLSAGNSDDSATISAIADAVKTVTKTQTSMTSSVTLSDLFDGTGAFYSYGGSLTTPTCLEIVTWIVMATPKSISMNKLAEIWQYTVSPGTAGADPISKYGNYRPLQSISSRTLYNSAGTTAACTAVTEPTFNCNAASSSAIVVTSPFLGLQSFALLLTLLAFMH